MPESVLTAAQLGHLRHFDNLSRQYPATRQAIRRTRDPGRALNVTAFGYTGWRASIYGLTIDLLGRKMRQLRETPN